MDKKDEDDREKPGRGRPNEDHEVPRAPELEEEGRLEFALLRLHEERFDPKRWEQAIEFKRQMPHLAVGTQDPGPAILEEFETSEVGVFISKEFTPLHLRPGQNPDEKGSFGFVGSYAAVETEGPSLDGLLALRFDPAKLGWVVRESLRLFRWEESTERFVMIPGSDVSRAGDYVFGQISQPGLYTIIGVNAYPLVLGTIRVLCNFRDLILAVPPEIGRHFQDRICQLILCAPDLMDVMKDSIVLREASRANGWEGFLPPEGGPGLPPLGDQFQDWCERCTGIRYGSLPECEIIDRGGILPVFCVAPRWETVGPIDLSGCIKQVVVDPSDSNRIYAAAANGGVWVLDSISGYPTTNWRPLTDELENLQMRAVAVARSDPQILYAANGLRYLYRSPDRGVSWSRTSNTDLGEVRKILVHPSNPQTVIVASHHGLYISFAGGGAGTWTLSHAGDVLDAVMDPLDSSIIYIAERGVGIRKTTTMGFGPDPWPIVLNWSRATSPSSSMIKIALGYRNADGSLQFDSNRTIAAKLGSEVFTNQRGGRDSGTDWQSRGARGGNGYGDWCHAIAVDPFNPNVILAAQQELFRTDNGGTSWSQRATYYKPHEDQQSIAFDPNNSGVVYLANDGGVFRSTDGGQVWYVERAGAINVADEIAARRSLVRRLITAEFYRVGVQGNHAVGNLYHSGIIASSNLSTGTWEGIEGHAWEFQYIYADPKRLRRYYVFAGELLRRRYPGTGTDDFIVFGRFTPYISGGYTSSPVGAIAVDTRPGSETILVGAGPDAATGAGYRLMVTRNGNQEPSRDAAGNVVGLPTWTAEVDNGRTDPIVSIMFAPSLPGKAYAISESGKVYSKNDVNAAGAWVEPGRWVTSGVRQLAVHPRLDSTLYAITSDRLAYSADSGASWTEIGAGQLPRSEFNSIVAHRSNPRILYLGADSGVYVSPDAGNTWSPFDTGLPNAEVLQIYWENNHLYAVTYGRGLWRINPC